MSENYGDLTASGENIKVGPDFFGLCTSEVAELLSEGEGLLPFPHIAGKPNEVGREKVSIVNTCKAEESIRINDNVPLFSNGIGALLSEFRKERLKLLLRQSVHTLTQEVDEMIDPVISFCRLRLLLRCPNILSSMDDSACKSDQPQHPQKKLKTLPAFSDSESEHMNLDLSGNGVANDVKTCFQCQATSTPPDGTKSICSACGPRYVKDMKNESSFNSATATGKESEDLNINDDLRFLIENNSTMVEGLVKKQYDEFAVTLDYMEHKLEELLNILMTSCRPMTIAEKQQLRILIQNLPPGNLDRAVEIIGHNKPSEGVTCDQLHVDLDELEEVTLWRLYFYVTTIQK